MKTFITRYRRAMLCAVASLAVFPLPNLCAQDTAAPPPAAAPKFSPAELEKLAAPIALHPDPLIAILLPASVYPLEVVQAARFVKNTNNIPKVDAQPWDSNVKAVAKFPELIAKMDAELEWTTDLGVAFVDQQKELMDTIQALRAKANTAGVLKTSPQQVVVVTNTVTETKIEQQVVLVTNTVVQIQPSNPQVVYVPSYPPSIYYSAPVYYGAAPFVSFAAGVTMGAIIANNCDWNNGGVNIDGDVNINTGNINSGNRATQNNATRNTANSSKKWQPDQTRKNASGAGGTKANTQTAQAKGWSQGAGQAGAANNRAGQTASATGRTPQGATANNRPAASQGAATRPSPSSANTASRPAAGPSASPSASRPSPGPSANTSANRAAPSAGASGGSAFGNVSSGASAQKASSRGSASSGGSRGGGGGGGSRGGGGGGRR